MFNMLKKNDKGFTLVELMVVVLIIGILVAIAIPIFNNASESAKNKTCAANIRTINGAIAQYAAVEGIDIADVGVTVADLSGNAGYLKEAPECPQTKAGYTITNGSVVLTDHGHAAP